MKLDIHEVGAAASYLAVSGEGLGGTRNYQLESEKDTNKMKVFGRGWIEPKNGKNNPCDIVEPRIHPCLEKLCLWRFLNYMSQKSLFALSQLDLGFFWFIAMKKFPNDTTKQ